MFVVAAVCTVLDMLNAEKLGERGICGDVSMKSIRSSNTEATNVIGWKILSLSLSADMCTGAADSMCVTSIVEDGVMFVFVVTAVFFSSVLLHSKLLVASLVLLLLVPVTATAVLLPLLLLLLLLLLSVLVLVLVVLLLPPPQGLLPCSNIEIGTTTEDSRSDAIWRSSLNKRDCVLRHDLHMSWRRRRRIIWYKGT